MQTSPLLHAVFGGTFDPIHYGHLHPVEALAKEIGLQRIILLPNHVPPHRPQPEASPEQRLAMVEIAIQDNPLFSVDKRELQRPSPSYTIDTLQELRAELGHSTPLAFIIGQDSLLTLHTWHRWQELLDYCHLVVCARPGYASTPENTELKIWLKHHLITSPLLLKQRPCGYIYLAHTPLLDISATEIRSRLATKQQCDQLLPHAIQDYIEQNGLYR